MYSNHTRPERLTPIKAILALISVCCCQPEYLMDPLWFLLKARADEGNLVRYDAFSLSVGSAGLWAANHSLQAQVPGSTAVLQSNYGLFTLHRYLGELMSCRMRSFVLLHYWEIDCLFTGIFITQGFYKTLHTLNFIVQFSTAGFQQGKTARCSNLILTV